MNKEFNNLQFAIAFNQPTIQVTVKKTNKGKKPKGVKVEQETLTIRPPYHVRIGTSDGVLRIKKDKISINLRETSVFSFVGEVPERLTHKLNQFKRDYDQRLRAQTQRENQALKHIEQEIGEALQEGHEYRFHYGVGSDIQEVVASPQTISAYNPGHGITIGGVIYAFKKFKKYQDTLAPTDQHGPEHHSED